MRPRWTPFELAALTGIVAAGAVVRWWHLDGPALWWDEVIHVGTSDQPTVWEVIRRVKLGSPPGSGNAGAVPLDYVLQHFWQRFVPMSAPEHLERHFRFPAFVWSAVTPLALHLWARRHVGVGAALAAATCLALATMHVAYGVEARFYALFGLMTVASLASFTWVLRSRRPVAWAVFTLTAAAYFLTGLFGLLVLAVEYAVLGLDVVGRWAARKRRPERWRPAEVWMLAGTASIVAVVPAVYYWGTSLAVKARTSRPPIDVLEVTRDALWTYVSASPVVAALLALGVATLVVRSVRGGRPGGFAATMVVLLVATIPTIAAIERWKLYYFHVRHAVFLMPVVALGVGVGAGLVAGWVAGRRSRLAIALAPLVVAAALAPSAVAYLGAPASVLWRTKALRDVDAVAAHLSAQLVGTPRQSRILLIAPDHGKGPLTNPVVQRYLLWWGIADRVVFRGAPIMGEAFLRIAEACGRTCQTQPGLALERRIGALGPPFLLAPDALALLGLRGAPRGRWPGIVAGAVVLDYDDSVRLAAPHGFVGRRWRGVRLWRLGGERPAAHPSTPPAA